MTQREFEFFVTTEEPQQPAGAQRGLIRRLVMRNFFETKWSGVEEGESSEMSSEATIRAKEKLKTRFRLGQMTDAGKKTGSNTARRPRVAKAECEAKKDARPKANRTRSAAAYESQRGVRSRTSSRKASPADSNEELGLSKDDCRMSVTISPSANRFDPFDVLPVPGTQKLDLLFRLHRSGSRVNSLTINARKTWWTFISNDAGLLHATLATWALYGILARGLDDLRVEKLRHKNEAIKEINTKIGHPGGAMSDELIGTIATLASFENLLGQYEAAQLHMTALKNMVNARGGLFAFGHNDGLIRGIQWVDLHTAAVFRTVPVFPLIRLDPDVQPFPEALLEEAAFKSPTSLLQLPVAGVDCFNIFYRLHRLALAISAAWIGQVSRLTFSTLLYEVEHIILSVRDYSRDFLEFDLDPRNDSCENYEQRKNWADGASLIEALLAAAQMFVFAALRELPPQAKIFKVLLERLRVATERRNVSTLALWKKTKSHHILLWVLAVASSVATPHGCSSVWINRLAEVAEDLGITNRAKLEACLERVAWTDVFFGNKLDSIWAAMRVGVQDSRVAPRAEFHGTIDPKLLQRPDEMPSVAFEKGRWRVGGWYV